MNYGERTLQIASLNVDSLRTQDSIYSTIHNLNTNNIDIACIQETHNDRIDSFSILDYTIFFGGCITNYENNIKTFNGGVAFIVHNQTIPHIVHINRINGRLMEIQFKTGDNIPNISILNSYAPHMGYNSIEINKYWNDINNYLNIISTDLVKIWCADNNGQLSRNDTNQTNIGPWAKGGG